MLSFVVAAGAIAASAQDVIDQTMPRPELRDAPPRVRTYTAPSRGGRTLDVDGKLGDVAWRDVPWTEPFTDIEGLIRPAPRFATRAKMTWDDENWYIAAQLEEPDIWATIRGRDAVIFYDNDFEVFVDPDGDTHRYFELEVNGFGTPWDLFLPKPYRDGGRADNAWNIEGLRVGISIDGTANDARDRDRSWSVELAIPWKAFADSGRNAAPRVGDVWHVNLSRVEWDVDTVYASYRKRTDPSTGKPLPEHNWVWSPQGAINMHLPEMWALVRFGGTGPIRLADDTLRWALRRVYYAQREYHRQHGTYAPSLAALGMTGLPATVELSGTSDAWSASVPATGGLASWRATADGRIFRSPR